MASYETIKLYNATTTTTNTKKKTTYVHQKQWFELMLHN